MLRSSRTSSGTELVFDVLCETLEDPVSVYEVGCPTLSVSEFTRSTGREIGSQQCVELLGKPHVKGWLRDYCQRRVGERLSTPPMFQSLVLSEQQ